MLVAACTGSSAPTTGPPPTTRAEPAQTTVTAATTTTTVPATTTTTPPATTTTTTTSGDSRTVDLTTPCGVLVEWVARAADANWTGTWELTHPVTRDGLPDLGVAGRGSPDEVYQDELSIAVAPWASAGGVECTFHEFGMSYGERVGVAALVGTVALGAPGPSVRAAAWPMRTRSSRWLVDDLANHVSLVLPAGPFEQHDASSGVQFTTPVGTFDILLAIDGTVVPVTGLDESPDDRVVVGWVPGAPLAPGIHDVVVATMLENGLLAALATTWEVTP